MLKSTEKQGDREKLEDVGQHPEQKQLRRAEKGTVLFSSSCLRGITGTSPPISPP